MRNRFIGSSTALIAGIALASLASGSVAAQKPPTGAEAWNPPRTADGQPDIQGFWSEAPGGGDSTNVETAMQTALTLKIQGRSDAEIAARKPVSSIVDPPSGKIPYQPWAEKRRQQILSRYAGDTITGKPETVRDLSSELLCVLGVPRQVYAQMFQIVQTPGQVVMSWERTRNFRVIPLDEGSRPRLPAGVKMVMGDSRGRWEGNTLVVTTTNLNDWSWFDSKGTPHTDAMSLLERFTLVDAKTLGYQVTVTDPQMFTQPWTMAWTFRLAHPKEEGFEFMEYACSEGERGLEAVLGTDPRKR